MCYLPHSRPEHEWSVISSRYSNLTSQESALRGSLAVPAVGSPQQHMNSEVHDWYQLVWGFSDHQTRGILDSLDLSPGAVVLDPFCGAGTTVVESRLAGFCGVGVDANPVAVLATSVKTTWSLLPEQLLDALDEIRAYAKADSRRLADFESDATYRYLKDYGLFERGWISAKPLRKALTLKQAIQWVDSAPKYRRALQLALLRTVVREASNVKYGPELYCGPRRPDAPVLQAFANHVALMAMELTHLPRDRPLARVRLADSRSGSQLRQALRNVHADAIVCSPPYPTEHDYTRNTRLELAFMEAVVDKESLRGHKRRMLRSHTKGIYVGDNESLEVKNDARIQGIVSEINEKVRDRHHGFARLYGRVISEYFGGMRRHLRAAKSVLRRGASALYVVGDQASYASVPVATASILAELAEAEGFRVEAITEWRSRRASTTSRKIAENVLHLRSR